MLLERLISGPDAGALETKGDLSLDVTAICNDHRKVPKGGLFVCIEGFRADGHDYIEGAVGNGAAAILTQRPLGELEARHGDALAGVTLIRAASARRAQAALAARFYGDPSESFALVGVTGTKGKTTTTHMINAIARLGLGERRAAGGAAGAGAAVAGAEAGGAGALTHGEAAGAETAYGEAAAGAERQARRGGELTGLIGTIKNLIGDEEIAARETTPESIELQKLFSDMRERGVGLVAMEVSSQGLALDRVSFCDFDVGLFTNFYNDHISPFEHKNLDEYLEAKLKLFELCDVGIANADMDGAALEAARRAAERSPKCRRLYT
ncbi:MAG: Mur ligase domain-containing protein, partial [Clostridiales bacterium]|nr:Mur ligase domain-containing protein [Clostridiales bacterium]